VKGAFTAARADRVGGSNWRMPARCFWTKIANVPLNLQAKLLRVLETGDLERVGSSTTRRVNVRVLAATNADVECGKRLPAGFARTCSSPEYHRDPHPGAARPP